MGILFNQMENKNKKTIYEEIEETLHNERIEEFSDKEFEEYKKLENQIEKYLKVEPK